MKFKLTLSLSLLLLSIITISLSSCKKDEPVGDVIASFYYEVDATDYSQVQFYSTSQNFESLSWDFGDGNTSTEENPIHVYTDNGDFTVVLTATGLAAGTTDDFSDVVSISDPNELLTTLAGDDTKTWKLLRTTDNGRYPLEVGPADYTAIWWAVGLNNDEVANRPCMFNDEWTFGRDGSMVYDSKGDYWAEGGIFTPDNICASTADAMVSGNGEDLSAWAAGNHSFELETGTEPKITAIGTGAFIGFFKSATEYEVTKLDPMVQEEVTYNIVKLSEGDVDTLIVETLYKFEVGDAAPGGYWRFVLVHYDNPADEPDLPGNSALANFSMELDGRTATFTNASQFASSYLWDFGDGITSTEENPLHIYTNDGIYNVSLTATNAIGESVATATAFVSGTPLTNDLLMGDPWRIVVGEKMIFVGSGMGKADWWSVPVAFLDGSSVDAEDWSCMADDEFTFSAGNVFTYATNGTLRNDGYMGSPNGCWAEADLTGNGAAFGSGSHTYDFTPGDGSLRPVINLTNGGDKAAFLGFYKGYYGGENTDGANAPNGGNLTNTYEVMGYANSGSKEFLFISVDITGDHSATASWSAILER